MLRTLPADALGLNGRKTLLRLHPDHRRALLLKENGMILTQRDAGPSLPVGGRRLARYPFRLDHVMALAAGGFVRVACLVACRCRVERLHLRVGVGNLRTTAASVLVRRLMAGKWSHAGTFTRRRSKSVALSVMALADNFLPSPSPLRKLQHCRRLAGRRCHLRPPQSPCATAHHMLQGFGFRHVGTGARLVSGIRENARGRLHGLTIGAALDP